MSETLIKGGIIVTIDKQRRIIKDGAIVIKGDKIVAIGKKDEIIRKYNKVDVTIDATGKLVLPGLIDTHIHHIQTLARGIADDVDLVTWIHDRILPYEAALDNEATYLSAMLACIEMVKTGTTTGIDPGGYRMENVAKALNEIGMRGLIAWASMDTFTDDRPIPKEIYTTTEEALKANEDLIKKFHRTANDRIRTRAAIRIETNATDRLVKEIDELARRYNTGVEMHAAVAKEQVDFVKKRTGLTVVKWLDSLKVLGPHWLLIHMGWIDDEEVNIIKERDVRIAHVPGASMKGAYGSGRFGKFPELIKNGVIIGLGCDSTAANNSLDMFRAMWLAATLHKEVRYDPTLISPEEALEMATINAAKAVQWEDQIGSLEVGKKADIIIVNINKSNLLPIHDFSIVPNLVYSGDGQDVETVIIDGKIVMEKRKIITVNEEEILAKAQKAAERIVSKIGIDKKLKSKWPIE